MSHTNRQFSIEMESYPELKDEVSSHPSQLEADSSTTNTTLAKIGPLPREALLLGIATDGLPVLLNLHDSIPGPLLVTGEAGSGKTIFLQSIVRSLIQTHQPNDLQYGIVTSKPEDWDEVENTNHRVGIFSTSDKKSQELVFSMAAWAHDNKKARQSVLLLVDDLEDIAKLDFDTVQNFRWLLARGPSRRVWPIVTMSAERYGQVISWIPLFRTRIFGRIENERVANALGGDKVSALGQLDAPNQFSLRENDSWIRFTRPG